ncbi:MAG: hypothetical protein IJ287_08325 [Methanobrevibacter sp.]|nr:hypothetical protein [Methanobrevibacter sp.]
MINRNTKFLVFLLFLLIITIPVAFANENLTGESLSDEISQVNNANMSVSDDGEILRANDVYFDASAASDGSGSESSPYKTVSSSKLGTINHFAPGTYTISSSLSALFSSSAMTFVGENRDATVLHYTGSGNFISTGSDVTFSTITLKGASIVSTGGLLTATNTVFDSGTAPVEEESDHTYYDNSYGGAIKQSISSSGLDWGSIFGGSTTTGMKITDCVFKNNYAAYGGAIYVEGGTCEIKNTKFESNNAKNHGGAISAMNDVKLTVDICEFDGDFSQYDAGGAIYAFNCSSINIKDSNFNDCMATFGPAIASLESTVTITNSNFNKNRASWQGGAVYAMYGSLTVTSSRFNENSAKNGGAVFADNMTYFEVSGGEFKDNVANDTAGAIFAFSNKVNRISTTYTGNSANKNDDLYQTNTIDLIIGNDDYEMIQYKSSYNGALPSKYDLRSLGWVTPVKNQGQSGNCWAFASMATLESAILKATGKQYDLSEGNLKNLANRYSDIGWDYETNNGGMYPFVFGYLTSWAGPVNASLDPTDDWDVIAPILNSAVHIQNILFLQRTSFTDNSAIKKAIMDYGAVASEIYWSNSYIHGNDYYYTGDEGRNHAISVVGWDDTRTVSGAPGPGVWIIKNSYGTTHGDGGYYYVSYYDKSLFRVYDESYNSFAVVFNDTIRFNRNYQYDAAFTDYFITGNKEMWYKNTFTSSGNDILQAFSTYFRRVTTWEAQIFVNDELKSTQSGKSNFGYYTINLDNPIPLKAGDNFTVSLKITCNANADIPISESGPQYTLVKQYFKPGVSFFSTDGKTWVDFYGYKATYGSGETGHNYFNQVACIKAFTSKGSDEIINTTVEIINVNSNGVAVKVLDSNGLKVNTGIVEFLIDANTYVSKVTNGGANISVYLKPGNHNVGVIYKQNQYYSSSNDFKAVTLDKETPVISIETEDISYPGDLSVKVNVVNALGQNLDIPFTVEVNGVNYTQRQFSVSNLKPGNYTIRAESQKTDEYNSNAETKVIQISKIKPVLSLNVSDVSIGEKINVKVTLSDEITSMVKVNLNMKNYDINVLDGVGTLSIDNDLAAGSYTLSVQLEENEYYLKSTSSASFNVKKIAPDMSVFAGDVTENENATVKVYLPSDITETLTLTIDKTTYQSKSENGEATFNVSGLGLGKYEYTVVFNGNDKYDSASISDSLSILEKTRDDANMNVGVNDDGNNVEIDIVLPEDARGDITVKYGLKTLTKSPINGKIKFNIDNLTNGDYTFIITFMGDEKYKSAIAQKSVSIDVKPTASSTIKAINSTRAYLSGTDYESTFTDSYGNLLSDVEVIFIVNGNEYMAKTNQFGIAKLNEGFAPGTFEITIINPQTGENITNVMTIVERIVENKNIQMDYNDGSCYKVKVYADNGNPVCAGEVVTFKAAGITYLVKTDKDSYASLKLNLIPKTYTITAEYRGSKVSNKIVVKQIFKAKNISKKKSKKVKFSATLKSSKGKALAGKKITFKFKGKKYTAKTNKKGIATITLKNLKVGKYKITSTYIKSTIKNTIQIKK